MAESLKQKMLSGMFWAGLGQVWNLGVNFIITVILARLLMPEDFGVVAVISVCIAIFSVFIDSGFGAALIQKKDLRPEDCSSVFFVNLTMALLLYVALFWASPWIAHFFRKPILSPCIRVSSLTMIIGAFATVQNSMIRRELRMSVFFRTSVISESTSGIIGIVMALRGFGVWALVAQTVLRTTINTILLWIWGTWRPIFVISLTRLKGLFNFGWKLLCANTLDTVYNNFYFAVFGKLFNLSTLAYYNRGNQIPGLGMGIISNTITSVLFPAFSKIQNDREQMARGMQKIQSVIFFFVVPAMTLLFVISEPLILLLFGEKWLPAHPYMRIFCFVYVLYPFHSSNIYLLSACGRSDSSLTLEVIRKVQAVICLLLTYRHGPMAVAYGVGFISLLCAVENAWMSQKVIDFGLKKQFLNILPCTAISLICAALCWFICKMCGGCWAKTLGTSFCFVVFYLGISFFTKQIPQDVIQIVSAKVPFLRRAA